MKIDLYRDQAEIGLMTSAGYAARQTGFAENFAAMFAAAGAPDQGLLYDQARRQAYGSAAAALSSATGETVTSPDSLVPGYVDEVRRGRKQDPIVSAALAQLGELDQLDFAKVREAYRGMIDRRLARAHELNPVVPDPATFDRIIAAEATRLRIEAAKVGEGATGAGVAGQFAGGAAGTFQQPEQIGLTIATLPIGGAIGGAARSVLGRILATSAIEGVLAGGQQAALEAINYETRAKLGTAPSLDEIRSNILFAAAGGAVLGGGLRAAGELFMPGLRATASTVRAIAGVLGRPLSRAERDAILTIESEAHAAATGPGRGLDRHAEAVNQATLDLLDGVTPAAASSAGVAAGRDMSLPTSTSASTQSRPLASQRTGRNDPDAIFASRKMVPSQDLSAISSETDIVSPSITTIYHASNDPQGLLTWAETRVEPLKAWLGSTFGDVPGVTVAGARVKAPQEVASKIATGRQASQISDYLGGRLVVDSWDALDQVLQRLARKSRILQIDDFTAAGKDGDRAVHVQVLGDNGRSWELQIVPSDIRDVQHEGHKIYQRWRRREIPADQIEAAANEQAAARRLYTEAWAKWTARNGDRGPAPDSQALVKESSKASPERSSRVFTPAGRAVETEFQVVDADRLVASQTDDLVANPLFPQELQPRDRSRAASDAWITETSANLNPEQLGPSAEAGGGAPIAGADDVVESGNGRVLAIRRAYDQVPEKAVAYRRFIERMGFDTKGMKKPLLIRRRLTPLSPEERVAFVREANAPTIAQMSPAEQAIADAGRISDRTLELYQGGDITAADNRPFVRGFIDNLAPAERGRLFQAGGELNAAGLLRIRAALLARAYGDASLLAKLIEATDNNVTAIGKALMDAAPAWSQLRARAAKAEIAPEMDTTADLLAAVRVVEKARAEGQILGDLVAQGEMFGAGVGPAAMGFLRMMFRDGELRRPAGQQTISDRLAAYIAEADKTQPGVDMFGAEPVAPREILDGPAMSIEAEADKELAELVGGGDKSAAGDAIDVELARVLDEKDLQIPVGEVIEDGQAKATTRSARELLQQADDELAQAEAINSCAIGGGEMEAAA